MRNQENNLIWVVTDLNTEAPQGRAERGLGRGLRQGFVKGLSKDQLKSSMTDFLGQLDDMLETESNSIGGFEIAEITVSAQISADGKVCLLGSGVDLGVQGGLKFVLRRKQS